MPGSKYTRDEHQKYFEMLDVIGTRWQTAVGRPEYRNSTGWNLLTRLWREGPVKMSHAYEFMRDVRSPTTRRAWVQKAITDGLVECSDTTLAQKLRTGSGKPTLPRGQSSVEISLNPSVAERVGAFMDEVLDELLKTADTVRLSKDNTASM